MPVLARKLVLIVLLVAPAALDAQTFAPGSRTDVPQAGGAERPWASPIAGAEPVRGPGDTDSVTAASFTSPGARTVGLEEEKAATATSSANAPHEVSLSPSGKSELPRLSPPGRPNEKSGLSGDRGGLLPSLLTMGSSLAVVLGLFLLLAWTMRRAAPGGAALLSSDVVEVLGRSPLTHRQHLHLLRCGKKLLLVNVCAESVETLTEITEPEEVDRLLGLCRQSYPQSASTAFRQIFQQFTGERAISRPLGSEADEPIPLAGPGFGRSRRRLENDDA